MWTERHRWVVIASRKELAEGIAIAEKYAEHNSRVVKSQNGWYAVVLGPHEVSDIANLKSVFIGDELPADSNLSRGTSFIETSWSSAARENQVVSGASTKCFAIIQGKCSTR